MTLCKNRPLGNPYTSVERLPFSLSSSWFSNQCILACLLEHHPIQTCIEVGCWLGASALFMADWMKERGGVVYAVDHWLGSEEHQNLPEVPTLYQQFLSNVIHAEHTETIVPIRMSSLDAASRLDVMADLIYIDASHKEEDVYQDLLAWHGHLNPSGILCGDDWYWPSVRSAVLRFAKERGLKIDDVSNFWRLYQESSR